MSAAQQPVLRVSDAPHGTYAGFQLGCRCMWCRSARNATTVTVGAR